MRQARIVVTLVFATNGVVFGTWTPRIPAVQAMLDLDEAQLGLALLGPAAGSVASMFATGLLVQRFGSRRVTMAALAAFSLPLPVIGLAPSLPWPFAVLLGWGAAMGALDVAMNSAGLAVQRGYGRPILSGLHAAFSAGGLAGALLGTLAAAADVPVVVHLTAAAAVSLTAAAIVARTPLPDLPHDRDGRRARGHLTPAIAALGLLAFAGLLAEGAVADWSAVYLTGTLGTSAGMAGAGFVAFSVTMTLGRLAGDRIVAAVGPVRTVRVAATVAAAALAAALLAGELWAVVAGFAVLGAGLSVLVPVVFTAAAQRTARPATAVATVSTCGYLGFIAGPPAIGALGATFGMPVALGVVAALTAGVGLLAGITRPPSTPAAADPADRVVPLT